MGVRLLAAVVLAGLGGAIAATAPARPSPVVVPFVHAPLPGALRERPVPPVPPIVAPPCRAGAVVVEAGPPQGVPGGRGTARGIALRNVSDQPCSLVGNPNVTADADGVPVRQVEVGDSFIPGPYPARDLLPGQSAWVVFRQFSCQAQRPEPEPVPADALVFHLNGGDVAVPLALNAACGLRVTPYGSSQAPDVDRSAGLIETQLWLPPMAERGAPMLFTVSLTNRGPARYPLVPCRGYRFYFSGEGVEAPADEGGLNCDALAAIEPGQTVHLAMEAIVPSVRAGFVSASWVLLPQGMPVYGSLLLY